MSTITKEEKIDNEDLIYKSAYTICYVALRAGKTLTGLNPYNLSEQYDEHLEWDRGREDALWDYTEYGSSAKDDITKKDSINNINATNSNNTTNNNDISLRDYFAAKALGGLLSGQDDCDISFEDAVKNITEISYIYADAMLEVRNK